jgi:hypothetical protein
VRTRFLDFTAIGLVIFAFPTSMSLGASYQQESEGVSTLCRFTSGPRAGQTQDYAPQPAIPIGSPCHNGSTSYGVVVGPDGEEDAEATEEGAMPQDGGAMSTICRFTRGPRAGQDQDYAPRPAVPIGTPCHDGQESFGTVVGQ